MADLILVGRKERSTPSCPPLRKTPNSSFLSFFPVSWLSCVYSPVSGDLHCFSTSLPCSLHSDSELLTAPQLNNKQMTSKAATAAALNSHQLASFHDSAHKLIDHYKLNTIKSRFYFQTTDFYINPGNSFFSPFFFSDLQRFYPRNTAIIVIYSFPLVFVILMLNLSCRKQSLTKNPGIFLPTTTKIGNLNKIGQSGCVFLLRYADNGYPSSWHSLPPSLKPLSHRGKTLRWNSNYYSLREKKKSQDHGVNSLPYFRSSAFFVDLLLFYIAAGLGLNLNLLSLLTKKNKPKRNKKEKKQQ